MKPDEIQQLLGGYATGTLTPQEQQALFDAALQDQVLFDALAREQALKEILDEPAARRELMASLEPPASRRARFGAWLRWPRLATASALAAAAVTVIAVVRYSNQPPKTQLTTQVVEVQPSVPAPDEGPRAETSAKVAQPREKRVQATAPARLSKWAAHEVAEPQPSQPPAAIRPGTTPPAPEPVIRLERPLAAQTQAVEATPQTQVRTSLVAADSAQPREARDLFYGGAGPVANVGARGAGIVGGVPGTAMSSRAMTINAKPAVPLQLMGVRYSVRDAQGSPPQLIVESNVDAVLYIFRRAATGDWIPVTVGGMSLTARATTTTPPIPVDGNAPTPRAMLLLSRAPVLQLASTGSELTAAIEKLRAQNQGMELLTQVAGGSTYVVTLRPAPIVIVPLTVP